ncbi:MAG: flavin monoamine oxidase family protein [Planctomycetota bacterium]
MTSSLERRRFLQLGGAALGASALGGPAAWAKPLLFTPSQPDFSRPVSAHHDVVVIGGGISGLTAAYTLKKKGYHNVKVLEVRGRVGGRTLNADTAGGGYVELGGQWVGPTQDAVLNMMGELGIGKFPTHTTGRDVDDTGGSMSALEYLDYLAAIRQVDNLSKQVPLDNPWNAAQAAQWDAMTVRDWMNANMQFDNAKDLMDITIQTDFGGSSRQISFLWFLFYVHSATDFNTMGDKAQRWRINGGSQTISLELADRLPNQVSLDSGVDSILWTDRGALVHYGGNQVVAAKKVIIAMMPKDMDRMNFFPQLPTQRDQLQRNWSTGDGDKYFATYSTPFWRQAGFSGVAYSDNQFIALAWDNTPSTGNVGVLGGFAIVEGSQRPPSARLRRNLVLRAFADFFGPQALNPIDFHEKSWGLDPLTEGCVTPLAPGLLTAYGPAIREPVGPIHWAGTESSTVWCGYMDGAVRAGKRAAKEVAALLP